MARTKSPSAVPNCRVQSVLPFKSYLTIQASNDPAPVCPGSAPLTCPVKYTPSAPTTMPPKPTCERSMPSDVFQSSLPLELNRCNEPFEGSKRNMPPEPSGDAN